MQLFEHLLILLAFVWISRKIFQAIHFPPLFGEIFAGILAGPLILGVVQESEALNVLAELGIFFLMFHAGMETNPKDLFRASKAAIWVAAGGILLPLASGYAFSHWYGYDVITSLFVALSISVTAVVISARLFKDSKIPRSRVATVTMTAAIMTEVLMLILLTIFLDMAQGEVLDARHLLGLIGRIVAYFAVVFYIGQHYSKYLYRIIYKGNKGFTFSLILAFGFAVVAEMIGLHFIIGAFFAGLFLRKEVFDHSVYNKIEDRVFGLSYSFLGPIFFATLAFHLDLTAFSTLPWFTLGLFVVAVLSKVIGGALPAYWSKMSFAESLGIGVAMNSRGAVDLIIISIGLQKGLITEEIFSVLIFIAFATTLLSIMVIKPLVPTLKHQHLSLKERLIRIVT